MPRYLTASDRKNLIRLASTLEKGSPERRAILAGLIPRREGNRIASKIEPYPHLHREIQEDWRRGAITSDEFSDLAKRVRSAPSLREAEKIVQRHRKMRTASRDEVWEVDSSGPAKASQLGFIPVDGRHRMNNPKQMSLDSSLRVAFRYLTSARPIRINRTEVERLLDRVYRNIAHMGTGSRKEKIVGNHPDAIVMDSIVIKDVFGYDKEVFFALTAKPGRGRAAVTGGGFGYVKKGPHRGQPITIVQLNGSYTWGGLVNPKVSRAEVTAVLMHELTHAADKMTSLGNPAQTSPLRKVDYTAYVNDPNEVRAFMREIYEEIRDLVNNVTDSPLAQDWGLGGTIQRFLRVNSTWKQIGPHLTRRNRNTILKGLVTAFEDDGIRVASSPTTSPPPSGFLEGSKIKGSVYHGTKGRLGFGHTLRPERGREFGIYLSPSHRYARLYGPNLYEVFVNIKNPIRVDGKSAISPTDLTKRDIERLRGEGFDGIFSVSGTRVDEIVAFDSDQVWVYGKKA